MLETEAAAVFPTRPGQEASSGVEFQISITIFSPQTQGSKFKVAAPQGQCGPPGTWGGGCPPWVPPQTWSEAGCSVSSLCKHRAHETYFPKARGQGLLGTQEVGWGQDGPR